MGYVCFFSTILLLNFIGGLRLESTDETTVKSTTTELDSSTGKIAENSSEADDSSSSSEETKTLIRREVTESSTSDESSKVTEKSNETSPKPLILDLGAIPVDRKKRSETDLFVDRMVDPGDDSDDESSSVTDDDDSNLPPIEPSSTGFDENPNFGEAEFNADGSEQRSPN